LSDAFDLARRATLVRASAAARTCPRAAVSHGSAAIAYRLPTLGGPRRGCLTVVPGTALRDLAGVHLHRATLTEADLTVVDDYVLTSPTRTVLDIAREHSTAAGLVVADAALRAGLTCTADLAAGLELCARWPGRIRAAAVVRESNPAAESPLESISRLLMRRAGLPPPVLQAQIDDRDGRFVARSDFYWPEYGVVGEADGNLKYDAGRSAIVAERRRQQALEDLGLIVVRWEWADLARFAIVIRRLRTAFARSTADRSTADRSTLHPPYPLTRPAVAR
jgi:hypothetical protein